MAKGSKIAEKIRSNVDRVRKQGKTDLKSVPPHRHCVVCRAVIRIDSDPPICSNANCEAKHNKNERSRKQLSILIYIFTANALL